MADTLRPVRSRQRFPDMFSKDDVAAVKSGLQEIEFGSSQEYSDVEQRYLDHYDLNFAKLPGDHFTALKHNYGYFDTSSHRIACHYFSPPEDRIVGTVFVLHGYYDHSGLYTKLINYFLEKNRAVIIYDLPGHGLSSGASAAIASFMEYQEVLVKCLTTASSAKIPQPWSIIAQSTGSAILMNYLVSVPLSRQPHFEKIVLLAPLIRPKNWRRASLLHWFLSPFLKKTRRMFAENSSDKDFLHFIAHSDPMQARYLPSRWVTALKSWLKEFENYPPVSTRVEVIQGSNDMTVEWKYNLAKIEKLFPNSTSYIIHGAQHQLVNESKQIREKIYSILDKIFS